MCTLCVLYVLIVDGGDTFCVVMCGEGVVNVMSGMMCGEVVFSLTLQPIGAVGTSPLNVPPGFHVNQINVTNNIHEIC